MIVFIYDKRESKPYVVLHDVKNIEERDRKITFFLKDETVLEVDKKVYKSTAYQN